VLSFSARVAVFIYPDSGEYTDRTNMCSRPLMVDCGSALSTAGVKLAAVEIVLFG